MKFTLCTVGGWNSKPLILLMVDGRTLSGITSSKQYQHLLLIERESHTAFLKSSPQNWVVLLHTSTGMTNQLIN